MACCLSSVFGGYLGVSIGLLYVLFSGRVLEKVSGEVGGDDLYGWVGSMVCMAYQGSGNMAWGGEAWCEEPDRAVVLQAEGEDKTVQPILPNTQDKNNREMDKSMDSLKLTVSI